MDSRTPPTPTARYLCVHGHFYQPPRENPWLEEIELQDSAYPYHDWNERIAAECYAPNADARILDERGRIRDIVNNYARISFNFGPTLLAWLAQRHAETYAAILDADRLSRGRCAGHGSALAQPYNHPILPLCNARDRETQVIWGLRDFEWRFERTAEGMWLPETACDLATLDVLARHGVRFTVLAPSQAAAWRRAGERAWHAAGAETPDTRRAYRVELPSGRSLAVFFYDGSISRAVAFERLLADGEQFARRLLGAFSAADGPGELVHIATDGETYGHHHRFGEMALAWTLDHVERRGLARLTNYGEFLALHPPTHEVRIREGTSWSCAHGLGRWSADCGCSVAGRPGWHQRWRAPLREALDWLRDRIAPSFEAAAARHLRDPWAARDAYIEVVLDRSPDRQRSFFAEQAHGELPEQTRRDCIKLLEMQRHAMLMYTSCGWFFDDVSGLEGVQVLQYAARAAQLAEELFGEPLEAGLLERLERAPSNVEELGHARRVYERRVAPARVDLARFTANHAAATMFGETSAPGSQAFHVIERRRRVLETGRARLLVGQARVASRVSGDNAELLYGFLHLGDHNLNGGILAEADALAFERTLDELADPFSRVDLPDVLRRLERRFGGLPYSVHTLFRDLRRRIVRRLLDATVAEVEATHERLYREHAPLIRFLGSLETPAPRALRATAELVLNTRLRRALDETEPDAQRLRRLLEEARAMGVELDAAGLTYAAQAAVERQLERLARRPLELERLERLAALTRLVHELPFAVDLARAENRFYRLATTLYPAARRAGEGGREARERDARLRALGDLLHVALEPEDAAPAGGDGR